MRLNFTHIILLFFILWMGISACEKEITVNLPEGTKSLVVEASINQLQPNLNYVFLTRTLDYFNPDVSLFGVSNALVYITPGKVIGKDTTFDTIQRVQLVDITTLPIVSQYLNGFSGIYFNPTLAPVVGTPYLLEIFSGNEKVRGITTIPKVIEIDTLFYSQEIHKKDTNMYVTFEFTDGPEQNNYRFFRYKSSNSLLIGWGSADNSRLFDDQLVNNVKRPYSFLNPFKYSDTLNLYLTSIGRTEYLFWKSYGEAARNGGPFSTPVQVSSNIQGAIGSFTGYGVSYRRVILR